ncbi:MAG: hypothetical protein A3C93_02270 [Candidatus Lloydbacteria bacterium RIFCSPHIGHO2_02_FULL_54_17]|uniref:Uncharacterized protein n=1 Tax=Candidatus Lloydbacteria bacterium RIFCSPHIGHO2_02_FULL_54_17 TaxID=1798664 RepID=A0A1G2DG26_9BACT|nr:MAG: hypothetical protein A3C93_02270 [Candidatus Lloydbacteria bacterium RIFCSPHIGHO2_02_FULL_54_17]OGZ14267.1 MAG: hypothetical protein A2948_01605 [Candidatus Lloydbacteria bacterium RIFCSPLOWO2_01_FULL_54_18]
MKKERGKRFQVLCQKWEESERGWGSRPDGYSLHVSEVLREQYIREYWSRMPDQAPDEYSRPDGTPYWCEVSEKTYHEILENKYSKYGLRRSGPYPGDGGTDGWVPLHGGGHGKI